MTTLGDLAKRLKSPPLLDDGELDSLIVLSDRGNAHIFFAGANAAEVYHMAKQVAKHLVDVYLNNPHLEEVPLRRKTRVCLVLNNFALYTPVRQAVSDAVDNLTNIFEGSMHDESMMPFSQELGRLSEHVLVLLIRLTNYQLRAAAVHEFTKHDMRLTTQLYIAILLKTPPYEVELCANCIEGIYGVTQPQTLFQITDPTTIQEHSCAQFTTKIKFIVSVAISFNVAKALDDALYREMESGASDTVSTLVVNMYVNAMRALLNMHKFCPDNAAELRKHVVASNLLQNAIVCFGQTQLQALGTVLRNLSAGSGTGEQLPMLLGSVNLCFRFSAIATYMNNATSAAVAKYCTLFHDALALDLCGMLDDLKRGSNARLCGQLMVMYVNLLHWMCNVDALVVSPELQQALSIFFRDTLVPCGAATLQAWQEQFQRGDKDMLVVRLVTTHENIDHLFTTSMSSAGAPRKLLGDLPSLKTPAAAAASAAAAVVDHADTGNKARHHAMPHPGSTNAAAASVGTDELLRCALTRNTMKHPVISPYGHTFEKEAIVSWLQQNGSVCPITGKRLTEVDLQPNAAVEARIMQQMVLQSMRVQPGEDDSDLYKF